ncbi:MAG: shikimate kinase [Thermoguttaceae bacterium]|nr:shikimate kinase [Thermoguttaceae bacterium]
MKNIALIGYRATGKTTVAKELASRLPGWNWVDADVEIERAAGKTIAQIFQQSGESGFRDLESTVTAELLLRAQTIIATGGGVVIRPENRERLKQNAFVVWLQASAETIYNRMYSDETTATRRPALTDSAPYEEIIKMLNMRKSWYEQTADVSVDTDALAAEQIADWIIQQYKAQTSE